MNDLAKKIEALLFTAGEAVAISELAALTKESEEAVRTSLAEVHDSIADSALALITTDSHAQLVTAASVADFLSQFEQEERQELSRAALETLSIIAYRGPIARFDIDTIRGVDSRRMIIKLLHLGLIRQMRTSGNVPLYDISEEFLSQMGLTRKEDLPNFAKLSASEELSSLLEKHS